MWMQVMRMPGFTVALYSDESVSANATRFIDHSSPTFTLTRSISTWSSNANNSGNSDELKQNFKWRWPLTPAFVVDQLLPFLQANSADLDYQVLLQLFAAARQILSSSDNIVRLPLAGWSDND